MSNRKSATASKWAAASKRGRHPKVAARAQRKKQAVVRSRKESSLRLVAAGSTEAPPIEVREDPKPETPVIDNRARAAALEAILQASLQNDSGQKTGDNNPRNGFDFSLPLANVQAYQAKLLEVTQANKQFAYEFIQRLATIRSPFVFWAVIAEFTGRRIIMSAKHSKELAAYSLWRIDSSRSLTAPPRTMTSRLG